jgi:hypothetical protein
VTIHGGVTLNPLASRGRILFCALAAVSVAWAAPISFASFDYLGAVSADVNWINDLNQFVGFLGSNPLPEFCVVISFERRECTCETN